MQAMDVGLPKAGLFNHSSFVCFMAPRSAMAKNPISMGCERTRDRCSLVVWRSREIQRAQMNRPNIVCAQSVPTPSEASEFHDIDDRQITHLICARLNMIHITFSGGVFGPFIQDKNKERKQARNTP